MGIFRGVELGRVWEEILCTDSRQGPTSGKINGPPNAGVGGKGVPVGVKA